jgi:hypothetical protein
MLEGSLLRIKNLSILFEDLENPNIGAELMEGLKTYCIWLHPYLSEYLKLTMN